MRFDRIVIGAAMAGSLSGCFLLNKFQPDCHKPQEYQRAKEVSPLIVPQGLDKPNTSGALTVPTVELAPPPPGPKDACLDIPPRYQPAPSSKAASSSG
jgi:uncharacterized lipoprotein